MAAAGKKDFNGAAACLFGLIARNLQRGGQIRHNPDIVAILRRFQGVWLDQDSKRLGAEGDQRDHEQICGENIAKCPHERKILLLARLSSRRADRVAVLRSTV